MSARRLDLFLEQLAQTPTLDVEDQAAACRTAAALRRFDRPMPRVLTMTSLESDPVAGTLDDILEVLLRSRCILRRTEQLSEDLLKEIKVPGHGARPGLGADIDSDLDQNAGVGSKVMDPAELSEVIWLLARARRDYSSEETAAQAAVFEAVAELLAGRRTLRDLITAWAPSWRWRDFTPWGVER